MMAVGASPRLADDDGRAGLPVAARFLPASLEDAFFLALPGALRPHGCCILDGTITVTPSEDAKTLLARRLDDALTRSGE